MDVNRLGDRVAKGMGLAARQYGEMYEVYRPANARQPLRERNRRIRLPAAFAPSGRIGGGGRDLAIWSATLDSRYTAEGDYLAGHQGIFFVALQRTAEPVTCVLTNRRVTVVRPSFAAQGGYNGLYATSGTVVIEDWPACMIASASSFAGGDGPVVRGSREVMLPKLPVPLQVADVMRDDVNATHIIESVQQTAMGWRVSARVMTP